MRIAILFLITTSGAWANACAVATSVTPVPTGSAASWTSCGGTTPQPGDSITQGLAPLQITSNLNVTGWTISGTATTLTWDGNPHSITVAGQIAVNQGCLATGTGCLTPFVVDTCTQAPATASATGSASSASTALTVSAVTGTIQAGMAVFGVGVAPGSTVTGSGSSWTLSIASTGPISGPVTFRAVITWTATGLTAGQGIFNSSAAANPPNYIVHGQVCNSLFQPGSAGGVLVHENGIAEFDSAEWAFRNNAIIGGGALFLTGKLGAITLSNVSSTGSSGPVWEQNGGVVSVACTVTAASGSTALTGVSCGSSSTYGLTVGSVLTGTNIQAGTTVTAYVPYPGTTATISLPTTGVIAAGAVTAAMVCSFTNVTQIATTSTSPTFFDQQHVAPACTVTGSALLTDAAGTVATSLTSVGNAVTNNLVQSYYTGNSQQSCFALQVGTSATHNVITGNAASGCFVDYHPADFDDDTNNFFSQRVTDPTGQGMIFGDPNPWKSRGDILVNDSPTVGSQYIGILLLSCSGPTISACSPQPDIGNMTMVMTKQTSSDNSGFIFGEGGPFPAQNVNLHDSIIIGNWECVAAGDTTTTFSTAGTGGVGLYNNNCFGWGDTGNADGINGYARNGNANHFNNGVTPNPSSTYGDLNPGINPAFSGTVQYPLSDDTRWALADAALGGPGTVANMFSDVMFARWSGAAPLYTTSQVVANLRAPFAPTAAAIKTAGSSFAVGGAGSYIGGMAPAAPVPSGLGSIVILGGIQGLVHIP